MYVRYRSFVLLFICRKVIITPGNIQSGETLRKAACHKSRAGEASLVGRLGKGRSNIWGIGLARMGYMFKLTPNGTFHCCHAMPASRSTPQLCSQGWGNRGYFLPFYIEILGIYLSLCLSMIGLYSGIDSVHRGLECRYFQCIPIPSRLEKLVTIAYRILQ